MIGLNVLANSSTTRMISAFYYYIQRESTFFPVAYLKHGPYRDFLPVIPILWETLFTFISN